MQMGARNIIVPPAMRQRRDDVRDVAETTGLSLPYRASMVLRVCTRGTIAHTPYTSHTPTSLRSRDVAPRLQARVCITEKQQVSKNRDDHTAGGRRTGYACVCLCMERGGGGGREETKARMLEGKREVQREREKEREREREREREGERERERVVILDLT